jgi:hypothetical protein
MTRTRASFLLRTSLLLLGLAGVQSCGIIDDIFGDDGGGGGTILFSPFNSRVGVASDTPTLLSGEWIVFLANEATSGFNGTDFNQDGDFGDEIVDVIHMPQRLETVLNVAGQELAILGSEIYFATDEDLDDRDWDLDGFANHLVLLHWSQTTGVVTFVATLNADGRTAFVKVGDRLYFCRDVSGPLFAPDTGLAYVDAVAPLVPVVLQNADIANTLRPRLITVDEGLMFLGQDETVELRDLNGDGDQTDEFVLALFDTTDPLARVKSVGLAVRDEEVPVRAMNRGPSDWLVGFLVNEDAQAEANFNDPALFTAAWQPPQCAGFEDADTDDDVLHFLQFALWDAFPGANPPVNTGLAGTLRVLAVPGTGGSPGFVATIQSELDEGTCSLNLDPDVDPDIEEDIDQDDFVLRWTEAVTPVLPITSTTELLAVNIDVPGNTSGVGQLAGHFLTSIDEASDSRDHDGFPDEDVTILAKLDPNDGLQAEWIIDQGAGGDFFVGPTWMEESDDHAQIEMAMSEAVMRAPLNSGDNDLLDSIAAIAQADPNNPGDIDFPGPAVATDPVFADIEFGGPYVFLRVSESADSHDYNNDGDQNDIVIFRSDVVGLTNTTYVVTLMNNVQETDAPLGLTGGSPLGAAFIANERAQNTDWNGDGDVDDFVLRWFPY